jgi:16S rRNA (guanine527-N7)-methyltransferase
MAGNHEEAVSQAAVPQAAVPAAGMFGDALPRAEKYAALLTGIGVDRGVVGPAEADRIWDRHLLNCGAVARLIPARASVVDLGSGAGLPGIVLSILLPGIKMTLLEPLARRVDFLDECVAALELTNVNVVRGRAEEYAGRLMADVVTSRAVAPLDKLVGLSADLARPGGRVLAIKGSSAEAELVKARPVLARMGVGDARIVQVGGPAEGAGATVVTFTVPAHRASGTRGSGRAEARTDTRSPGRRSGPPTGAAGSRKSRPNSRRAGG